MRNRRKRTRWIELGSFLTGAVLILAYAGSVFAAAAPCTTTGTKVGSKKYALKCSGECPPAEEGGPKTACILIHTVTQGGQPGATCGCPGQLPPICCHLVGIGTPEPGQPYVPTGIGVGGTCPPCPDEGQCKRVGAGREGDEFEADCKH